MRRSAGILIRVKNEVLLCKRSLDCRTLPGHWSIPGGGIEKNESSQNAALREFFEETNIKINKPLLYVGTSVDQNNDHKMDVFLVDFDEKISVSLEKARDGFEHIECGYFPIDNLPTPIPEKLKQIIKQI